MRLPANAKTFIVLCTALVLVACTRLGFAYLNSSAQRADMHISKNIAYGPAPWQVLDVYQPASAPSALPVVLFFYGGGWTKGSKDDYLFVADRLARAGFVVVIPDYVKYPQERFPTFMKDAAKAAKWAARNIQRYNGNPQQLQVMGHSAGGLMGALLISDRHYLAAEGLPTRIFKGFVGLAGPYDFTPDEEPYTENFTQHSNYTNMQVTHFINGSEPPMLLQYGDADDVVGYSNIEKLVARVQQMRGRVQVHLYPKRDHVDVIADFSQVWEKDSPVAEDAIAFLKANVAVRSRP